MALVPAARNLRQPALDGIRGIAIILVVLSHGWTLFPIDQFKSAAPLDSLIHGGNLGVSIFLVVGGFLVTRSLLATAQSPVGIRPGRFLLLRLARIGSQLYPALLAVLVLNYVDPDDTNSHEVTIKSLIASGTYTWNWYLERNVFSARADLGHLWYLSVQEQFYVVLVIVLAVITRAARDHTVRLAWSVVALIVLVTMWRAHVYASENGAWLAPLRTTTRMDGLLYGMLAALVVDRLAPWRAHATRMLMAAGVALAALILVSDRYDNDEYYRWYGVAINLAVTAFVIAAFYVPAEQPNWAMRAATYRPLVVLGSLSLAIYIWHYPLFWAISRHTQGWGWFERTLLAALMLVALVYCVQRFLDRPAARWIQRWKSPVERTRTPSPPEALASGGGAAD